LNIVVIGYRGTGKGAVGKLLAKKLGFGFVDTDHIIREMEGRSIPEIFEMFGEEHFRKLESRAVAEACSRDNFVVATGGGAPMRKENAAAIKRNSIVVLLDCAPEAIHSRIEGDPERPPLTTLPCLDEIKFLLKKRMPVYRALADFVADTSTKSIAETTAEILAFLKEKGIGGRGNAKG
jgi:shikimate kinase